MIEKISGLNGLKNLRVLSVGRNYIKSFNGLVSVYCLIKILHLRCMSITSEFRLIGRCGGNTRRTVDQLQSH